MFIKIYKKFLIYINIFYIYIWIYFIWLWIDSINYIYWLLSLNLNMWKCYTKLFLYMKIITITFKLIFILHYIILIILFNLFFISQQFYSKKNLNRKYKCLFLIALMQIYIIAFVIEITIVNYRKFLIQTYMKRVR